MPAEPRLTVVVTVVSDTLHHADAHHLEGCLEALRQQIDAPHTEVLVTCDGHLAGIEHLQKRYPEARFICAEKLNRSLGPDREHHDQLRSFGLRQARAPLIALVEDCGRPDPHWCATLVKEHEQPYAGIGGAMENGIDRPLNWAVYFGDFGRYQNPVPRGPSAYVSDANVCYKAAALNSVADSWSEAYNEARVHSALSRQGETLALSPKAIVYQHRLDLQLGAALRERCVWGRSFAATRVAAVSVLRRAILAAASPVLPLMLLFRQFRNILRTRRNGAPFLRALPLTALLNVAWSFGEFVGYVTGHP